MVREKAKSWTNWHAYERGQRARSAHEFYLYSDSALNGTAREFGPFRLMNLLAGERREGALSRPIAALRIRYASNPNLGDDDAEHGKRQPDEIAALVSLILGVRVQAGGEVRHFDLDDDAEPLGEPRAVTEVETPILLPGSPSSVIPNARRTVRLDQLDQLEVYPKLEASMATALLRAARLYQEALWISEREVWLTWLLLVSAVETAAQTQELGDKSSSSELLKELDPKLAAVAAKYGESCLAEVAETQVKLLGATKKFLGFLQAFMPPAPAASPARSCGPPRDQGRVRGTRPNATISPTNRAPAAISSRKCSVRSSRPAAARC